MPKTEITKVPQQPTRRDFLAAFLCAAGLIATKTPPDKTWLNLLPFVLAKRKYTCEVLMRLALTPTPNRLMYSDKTLIAPLNPKKPIFISYKDIPAALKAAVLVREDLNFPTHNGVDLKACGKAALTNIFSEADRGCSTITMQVVKWLHSDENGIPLKPRTNAEKVLQISLARHLETIFTKEEILTAYFNIIDFNNDKKGVVAATSYLYGIEKLVNLSLTQIAILSAIIRKPGERAPSRGAPKPSNSAPAKDILRRFSEKAYPPILCQKLGFNGDSLGNAAKDALVNFHEPPTNKHNHEGVFLSYVRNNVKEQGDYITTLNKRKQSILSEHFDVAMESLKKGFNISKGSAIYLDKDAHVLAVCSTLYHNAFLATDQVGSLLKPILLASFAEDQINRSNPETGFYALYQQIFEARLNISANQEVTLEESLKKSLNKPFEKLLDSTVLIRGVEIPMKTRMWGLLSKAGCLDERSLPQFQTPDSMTHDVILGTLSSNVAVMARLYTAFLNEGKVAKRVRFLMNENKDEQVSIFSPKAADLVRSALHLPLTDGGTAHYNGLDVPESWGAKTGTTDNFTRAWIIIVTDQGVLAFCVQNENGAEIYGGNLSKYAIKAAKALT